MFGGTSNRLDFLPLDRAGNRRFLSVMVCPEDAEVHILEDEDASRAYLLQVWAEAMEIYRIGRYSMKFSRSVQRKLVDVQKDFMPEDTEAGMIIGFLENYCGNQVCSKQLYREALHHEYDKPKRWQIHDINEIMNTAVTGWRYFSNPRAFDGYGRQKGWERIADSGNEPPGNEADFSELIADDDLQGESASIANQRDMLEKYCERQGWEVVSVYQDDGYTGLNMERPDLKRMLKAIERRRVNLVITKDLSRLGRNYLQTGILIEDFFPRNGVRYIAMNDGIDTMKDNNDIAPFKNILNEMYSKDISKKVHSSYLLKAQKGQFTGCLAPFGYRKDPENKNHLLVDEETAPIVRQIFGYALEGHGPNYIRRRLEENKIPCYMVES